MSTTGLSMCRICSICCPVVVEVEDGVLRSVTGNPANEIYDGYTCVKGRAQPSLMNRPDRLLHSLKRRPDDSFERISSSAIIDEVAERLAAIIDRHGPRAVAGYFGTSVIMSPATAPLFS